MRVVLVGAGGWGKNHARILSNLNVLCAICDADVNTSAEFGKRYAVNHYTSVDELIKLEKFDAAIIATPTKSHFEIAKKLIEAKKHIFVEKPLTTNSKDGQTLIDFASKKKTIITCGYIERFNPAVNKVKSYIDEGKYGDLLTLEFHRYNTTPNTQDVGIIHDTAVHDIDTANYLFGQTPIVIFARAGSINHKHENYANIMLGYKNNRTAVISTSWMSPKKIRTFRAVCTKNTFTSDFLSQTVSIDAELNISSKWQEPLLLEITSFLDSINGDIITSQQAVNVTKIAEAALLSSQKGIPIYLELK